jgi:D-alanyl-lipoteichoic acid acyltransferase DltB (MBOAT superfamily)
LLFHTLEFAILFVAVLPFALAANSRLRRGGLLAASYLFYGWFSIPLSGLMLFSSVVDFVAGRHLHTATDPRARRGWLCLSLVANLGLLFVFKYTNWFLGTLTGLGSLFGFAPLPHLDIVLPLGISFYTFQTLSYTLDIHRGRLEPTTSFLDFALFVSFFPQLVAGPIVRAADLLPQLRRGPRFVAGQIPWAAGIFVFGMVKKVVFADNFAAIANAAYADPAHTSTWHLVLGTYAFAFQIYCDFSGYTDMARGVAAALGYDVGRNFHFPYFALGVRDFWKRWHISLSTWLRDYLYISLGGNRISPRRTQINVMLTMLLGGLWHGANWTFVVWGAIHGIWISVEHLSDGRLARLRPRFASLPVRTLAWVGTFHLVCLTWVFFRAQSITDAFDILGSLVHPRGDGLTLDASFFVWLAPLLGVEGLMARTRFTRWLLGHPYFYWLAMLSGLLLLLLLGDFRGHDFVYFQF